MKFFKTIFAGGFLDSMMTAMALLLCYALIFQPKPFVISLILVIAIVLFLKLAYKESQIKLSNATDQDKFREQLETFNIDKLTPEDFIDGFDQTEPNIHEGGISGDSTQSTVTGQKQQLQMRNSLNFEPIKDFFAHMTLTKISIIFMGVIVGLMIISLFV